VGTVAMPFLIDIFLMIKGCRDRPPCKCCARNCPCCGPPPVVGGVGVGALDVSGADVPSGEGTPRGQVVLMDAGQNQDEKKKKKKKKGQGTKDGEEGETTSSTVDVREGMEMAQASTQDMLEKAEEKAEDEEKKAEEKEKKKKEEEKEEKKAEERAKKEGEKGEEEEEDARVARL